MEQHLDQEQLEQVVIIIITIMKIIIKTIITIIIIIIIIIKIIIQSNHHQVQAAFALFDHDGDGRITIDELRHLYTSLGQSFSEVICDDWQGDIILKEVMVMRM